MQAVLNMRPFNANREVFAWQSQFIQKFIGKVAFVQSKEVRRGNVEWWWVNLPGLRGPRSACFPVNVLQVVDEVSVPSSILTKLDILFISEIIVHCEMFLFYFLILVSLVLVSCSSAIATIASSWSGFESTLHS